MPRCSPPSSWRSPRPRGPSLPGVLHASLFSGLILLFICYTCWKGVGGDGGGFFLFLQKVRPIRKEQWSDKPELPV